MFSQHRHEVFLVAAKFDQEYLDYLLDEGNINLDSPSFLELYCFGPFDIYNSEHIFTLARIITTLTIQLSMDWEGTGKRKVDRPEPARYVGSWGHSHHRRAFLPLPCSSSPDRRLLLEA
jgi:hypothetical protein